MTAPRIVAASNSAAVPATSGSQTITTSAAQQNGHSSQHISIPPSGTLRLRAEAGPSAQEAERRVQWAEGVVNNEGMNKKSSKVCCIYHKPRPLGESSDESSDSSSDDDSDAGVDSGAARPSKKDNHKHKDHGHDKHADGCAHHGNNKGKAPKRAPNAYEQIPKNV